MGCGKEQAICQLQGAACSTRQLVRGVLRHVWQCDGLLHLIVPAWLVCVCIRHAHVHLMFAHVWQLPACSSWQLLHGNVLRYV
jgi:hypothetical protein